MGSLGRAFDIPAVKKLERSLLASATHESDYISNPTLGHVKRDVAEAAKASPDNAREVFNHLRGAVRAGASRPNGRVKALEIIKYLCNEGPAQSDFMHHVQNELWNDMDALKDYQGDPDPLRGDAPSKAVRDLCYEIRELLSGGGERRAGAGSVAHRCVGIASDPLAIKGDLPFMQEKSRWGRFVAIVDYVPAASYIPSIVGRVGKWLGWDPKPKWVSLAYHSDSPIFKLNIDEILKRRRFSAALTSPEYEEQVVDYVTDPLHMPDGVTQIALQDLAIECGDPPRADLVGQYVGLKLSAVDPKRRARALQIIGGLADLYKNSEFEKALMSKFRDQMQAMYSDECSDVQEAANHNLPPLGIFAPKDYNRRPPPLFFDDDAAVLGKKQKKEKKEKKDKKAKKEKKGARNPPCGDPEAAPPSKEAELDLPDLLSFADA